MVWDGGTGERGKDADVETADGQSAEATVGDGSTDDGESAEGTVRPEEGVTQGDEAGDGTLRSEEGVIELERIAAERDQALEENRRLITAHHELQDAYARLRADFDNFRRRTREEAARRKVEAAEEVLRALLPVVDNMERAVQAAQAEGERAGANAQEGLRSGVELILQQLRSVMEQQGVVPAPGVGEPFDPRWHHAVEAETPPAGGEGAGEGATDHETPSGVSDGPLVVVEEFQKGYLLGGRALRPSLVKVGAVAREAGRDTSGKGSTR